MRCARGGVWYQEGVLNVALDGVSWPCRLSPVGFNHASKGLEWPRCPSGAQTVPLRNAVEKRVPAVSNANSLLGYYLFQAYGDAEFMRRIRVGVCVTSVQVSGYREGRPLRVVG